MLAILSWLTFTISIETLRRSDWPVHMSVGILSQVLIDVKGLSQLWAAPFPEKVLSLYYLLFII